MPLISRGVWLQEWFFDLKSDHKSFWFLIIYQTSDNGIWTPNHNDIRDFIKKTKKKKTTPLQFIRPYIRSGVLIPLKNNRYFVTEFMPDGGLNQ